MTGTPISSWRRRKGVDRQRQALGIDLVAELVDGLWMTGAVKWNRAPIGAEVHFDHLAMLRRAADAGRMRAHEALRPDAPLYHVAAGGVTPAFRAAVAASGRPAVVWGLEELYEGREGVGMGR